MHIAIKNCSIPIAIKKLETSSPNDQIWSNTFCSKLPLYVGGYLRVSAYAVPERRSQRWHVARPIVVVILVVVIAVIVVIAAASRIRMNAELLVQQDARPIEGRDRNPRRQAHGIPPADNNARRFSFLSPFQICCSPPLAPPRWWQSWWRQSTTRPFSSTFHTSSPNANGGCDLSLFVTITGHSSTPPFGFHQQFSWLSSCFSDAPLPPNVTKQCCTPPNSHQPRRRYITDISHGCAVAQGPSPPNTATRSEGTVQCPLQTTMHRCIALTPRPNNTAPPKSFGMMCVWPGMPNKSFFGGYYLWLEKRIHIEWQYGCRWNMDSFLLNKKGLEEISILPKNFCNMHIARCNMHIAIESILPLTHASRGQFCPNLFWWDNFLHYDHYRQQTDSRALTTCRLKLYGNQS